MDRGLRLSTGATFLTVLTVTVPVTHGRPFPVHKGDLHLLSRLRVLLSGNGARGEGATLTICIQTLVPQRGDTPSRGGGPRAPCWTASQVGTENGRMDRGELPGGGGSGIRQLSAEAFEPRL